MGFSFGHYLNNDQEPVFKDPKAGIFYRISDDPIGKVDSWLDVYSWLKALPENMKTDPELNEDFKEGYPIHGLDIQVMKQGIGLEEGKKILTDSLFKEEELRRAFTSEDEVKQIKKMLNRSLQTALNISPKHPPGEIPRKTESSLEQLELIDLKKAFPSISEREIDGYKDFTKRLKKDFQTICRVAVAVIAYCHQQNRRLTKNDLQELLDFPKGHTGADALIKYKGKLSRELIHDIYTELPEQYRYKRGQNKKE